MTLRMCSKERSWVIITAYEQNVMRLYQQVSPVEPDRQIIIYGNAVLKANRMPDVEWVRWLSMYKSYQSGKTEKDDSFVVLRDILVHLYGEQVVEELDSRVVADEGLELFGG